MSRKSAQTKLLPLVGLALALSACGSLGQGLDQRPTNTATAEAANDFAAGRFALALEGYRGLLAQQPGSLEALNGVAASYAMIGRRDIAERYFRRAVAASPHDPRTLANVGNFYLEAGRADVALVYLDEARRYSRDTPSRVLLANLARAESVVAAPQPSGPSGPIDVRVDAAEKLPRIERLSARVQKLRTRVQVASAANVSPGLASGRGDPPHRPGDGVDPPVVGNLAWRPDARLEISNGAGMAGMASTLAAYVDTRGIPTARLTNAAHFRHETSKIFYRRGFAAEAERLRAMLPGGISLERADDAQPAGVRLRLGGDLVPLTQRIRQERGRV